MNRFTVLIPVFNGAKHIETLLGRIPETFHSNILFVDDGSSDDSGNIIHSKKLRVIHNSVNRGKGYSIRKGIGIVGKSNEEFCILMDVDLQHPPEYISTFVKSFDPGTISLGYRTNRIKMPISRFISNFFTSLCLTIRTTNIIKDSQCGYRLIPRSLFNIRTSEKGFMQESELLMKACIMGYDIKNITIPTVYADEVSAINPWRETYQFVHLFIRSYFW